MKKFGVMIGFLLAVGAVPTFAATIDECGTGASGMGSVDITSVLGSGNTYTCGDKSFSNFTGLSGETGTLVFQKVTASLYKLDYIAPSTDVTAFDLNFRITVTQTPFVINQITDQMFTQRVDNLGNVPNGSTDTITHSPGSPATNILNASDGGGFETMTSNMATTVEDITSHFDGNAIPANGTPGKLSTLEFGVSQTSVPEPLTFSLMGIGLLGLGLLKKRLL